MTSQCLQDNWSTAHFLRNVGPYTVHNKNRYAVVMSLIHDSPVKSRARHRLRDLVIKCFGCQSCLSEQDFEDSTEYQNVEKNESKKSASSQARTCLRCISSFVRRGGREKPWSLKDALIAEEIFKETSLIDSHPVLNIGLGFSNQELRVNENRQIIYLSYKISKWDIMMKGTDFPSYSYFSTYDEPIVDGYPASIWFDMFEPTLGVLFALGKLKHRKTNLTKKRSFMDQLDTLGVPGDVDMDPWGHVFGPNLINIRRILLFPTEELTSFMRISVHETVIREFTTAAKDLFRTDRKNRSRRTYRPSVRRLKRPMKKVMPDWSYELLYDQSFSTIPDNSSSGNELFHDASENFSIGSEKEIDTSGKLSWHEEKYKEYYDESFDVENDESDYINSDEDLSEEHENKTAEKISLQSDRSSEDLCIEDNRHRFLNGIGTDKKTSEEDLAFIGYNQSDDSLQSSMYGNFRTGDTDGRRSLGWGSSEQKESNETDDGPVALQSSGEDQNSVREHDEIDIFIEEVLSDYSLQTEQVNEANYNRNNPSDTINSLSGNYLREYSTPKCGGADISSSTIEQFHTSLVLIPWFSYGAHQCPDLITWNTNQSADDEENAVIIPDTYSYRQDYGKFVCTYTKPRIENLKLLKQKWEIYLDQLLGKSQSDADNNLSHIVEDLKAEPITRRLFLKYVSHRFFVMDENLGISENAAGNRSTRYNIYSDPEAVPCRGSKDITATKFKVIEMIEKNAKLPNDSAVNNHQGNLIRSAYLCQAVVNSLSREQANKSSLRSQTYGDKDKDSDGSKCALPSDPENVTRDTIVKGTVNSTLNGSNEDAVQTAVGEYNHQEIITSDKHSNATKNCDPRMLENDMSGSRDENFGTQTKEETVSASAKRIDSRSTRCQKQLNSPPLNRKCSSGRKRDTFNRYSTNEQLIRPTPFITKQHRGDTGDVDRSVTQSDSAGKLTDEDVRCDDQAAVKNVLGESEIVIVRHKQCRKQDSLETIYDNEDLHECSSSESYLIYTISDIYCDKSDTSLFSREDNESVDERFPRFVLTRLHQFKQRATSISNTEMSEDKGDIRFTYEQNSNRNDIVPVQESESFLNGETSSAFSKRASSRKFKNYCTIDYGLYSGLQEYPEEWRRNQITKKQATESCAQKSPDFSSEVHELRLRPFLLTKLNDNDSRLESPHNIGDQSENQVDDPYLLALLPMNYQRIRNARQTLKILKGSRNKSLRKILRRITRTILNSYSRR